MKNILKLSVIGIGLFFATSCGDFGDTNVDPNNAASVPAELLLATALKETMDEVVDQWDNGRLGMVHAQYWSENQYSDESRYRPRTVSTNNFWRALFSGQGLSSTGGGGGMMDFTSIITQVSALKETEPGATQKAIYQNQIAVAHIARIYYAQVATDLWGDIPYSQSFKGLENLLPSFDKQSDLYPALLAELNESINAIDASLPGFSGGDILYNGDMTQWKKFANSLKLRLAIRMSDVKNTEAKAAIEEAVTSGVFESNSDNAYFTYGGSAPDNHPLNEDRKTRRDFSSSTTMVDYMKTTGDPRLYKYYDPIAGGTEGDPDSYVGRPYGQTGGAASAMPRGSVSQPSGYNLYASGVFRPTDVLRPDANAVYMDYAEVCFILAEAAARGYSVPGDAATWYANGIGASMNYWGIDDQAAIDAFVAANAYDGGNWKQSIGRQKWVALYMQGLQGWYEYSRLDFGLLVLPVGGSLDPITTDRIPTRLYYPTDAATLNGASYNAAVVNMGADNMSTRVWWDVQ